MYPYSDLDASDPQAARKELFKPLRWIAPYALIGVLLLILLPDKFLTLAGLGVTLLFYLLWQGINLAIFLMEGRAVAELEKSRALEQEFGSAFQGHRISERLLITGGVAHYLGEGYRKQWQKVEEKNTEILERLEAGEEISLPDQKLLRKAKTLGATDNRERYLWMLEATSTLPRESFIVRDLQLGLRVLSHNMLQLHHSSNPLDDLEDLLASLPRVLHHQDASFGLLIVQLTETSLRIYHWGGDLTATVSRDGSWAPASIVHYPVNPSHPVSEPGTATSSKYFDGVLSARSVRALPDHMDASWRIGAVPQIKFCKADYYLQAKHKHESEEVARRYAELFRSSAGVLELPLQDAAPPQVIVHNSVFRQGVENHPYMSWADIAVRLKNADYESALADVLAAAKEAGAAPDAEIAAAWNLE